MDKFSRNVRLPPRAEVAEDSPDKGLHDRIVLDGVREIVGPEKTQGYLKTLEHHLAGAVWSDQASDSKEMMGAAHSAISLAGQLGFSELSETARELEEAVLDKGDSKAALATFNAARARARPVLAGLIENAAAATAPE